MNIAVNYINLILVCITCIPSMAQIKDSTEKEIYCLGTISILDPIIVKFKEKDKSQTLLISKKDLDTIQKSDSLINYINFSGMNKSYYFFTGSRFSCVVNNYIFNNPEAKNDTFYIELQNKLRRTEKENIWCTVDTNKLKPKFNNGIEFYEIYPRRFLLFLVKGDALKKCQSKDEVRIKNMDNLYFKVLVPVTW